MNKQKESVQQETKQFLEREKKSNKRQKDKETEGGWNQVYTYCLREVELTATISMVLLYGP